jgi:hypothetical protein
VSAGQPVDQEIKKDRTFKVDDMVEHLAQLWTIADIVEPVALGPRH